MAEQFLRSLVRHGGRPLAVCLLAAAACVAAASAGCSRKDYRLRADKETYGILQERTQHPQWTVPSIQLEPSPLSRHHDPAPPDCPPLPPDDPAAHSYMEHPDHKPGHRHWHADGDSPTIEYHDWWSFAPVDGRGELQLNQQVAVSLGQLHSRSFQFELEQLYLDALVLTLERFEFDLRWFGRNSTFFDHFGSSRAGNESNDISTTSSLGFRRAFTAGGDVLVNFANTFVWEFTGTDTSRSNSTFSILAVQPLLRGAFRDVRLEPLTQAERNVLYSVRDFARFRKQFYLDIVAGNGGYLTLLLQLQAIRNQEANVESLRQDLILHEALAEAGLVSLLQVDQVFQQYQSGRLNLIRARNDYQTSLDNYKFRLGLPPEVPVQIDDSLLKPFELVDPAVTELEARYEQLLAGYRELEAPPPVEALESGYAALQRLHEALLPLTENLDEELARLRTRPISTVSDPGQRDREQLLRLQIEERLAELHRDVASVPARIDEMRERTRLEESQVAWEVLQQQIREQAALVADIYVLQSQIRTLLIELQEFRAEEIPSVNYALENRLDLMNQRALVVDNWRRIRVAADRLESDLDIQVSADVATEPGSNNPLNFSADASRYRVGFVFDGALNRLAERNAYRAQLINYQRSRRSFMERRDLIVRAIRLDLRELQADRLNFEIARQSLLTAARQVELARTQLLAPGQAAADSSSTQDVLNAQNSLLQAQNALISQWVSYETDRLQLLFDTEALQLDERGLLFDDSDATYPELQSGIPAPAAGPPPDGRPPEVIPVPQF